MSDNTNPVKAEIEDAVAFNREDELNAKNILKLESSPTIAASKMQQALSSIVETTMKAKNIDPKEIKTIQEYIAAKTKVNNPLQDTDIKTIDTQIKLAADITKFNTKKISPIAAAAGATLDIDPAVKSFLDAALTPKPKGIFNRIFGSKYNKIDLEAAKKAFDSYTRSTQEIPTPAKTNTNEVTDDRKKLQDELKGYGLSRDNSREPKFQSIPISDEIRLSNNQKELKSLQKSRKARAKYKNSNNIKSVQQEEKRRYQENQKAEAQQIDKLKKDIKKMKPSFVDKLKKQAKRITRGRG